MAWMDAKTLAMTEQEYGDRMSAMRDALTSQQQQTLDCFTKGERVIIQQMAIIATLQERIGLLETFVRAYDRWSQSSLEFEEAWTLDHVDVARAALGELEGER